MAHPVKYTKIRSRKNTFKVSSSDGYLYTRRGGYKGVEYWKCDLRNVCAAVVHFKDGKWIEQVSHAWEKGSHRSHGPDMNRYKQLHNTL
jgi:hypothetical protein